MTTQQHEQTEPAVLPAGDGTASAPSRAAPRRTSAASRSAGAGLTPSEELARARSYVELEYARRHGAMPTRAEVNRILSRAWYRLSDAAAALAFRAVARDNRRA